MVLEKNNNAVRQFKKLKEKIIPQIFLRSSIFEIYSYIGLYLNLKTPEHVLVDDRPSLLSFR